MLYKLNAASGIPDKLTPLAFGNLNLEKHLENLMAAQMAGVLFEDNEMMPIFQERSQQPEADIYALNEKGDLIIFELKRGPAGGDAVYQALRTARLRRIGISTHFKPNSPRIARILSSTFGRLTKFILVLSVRLMNPTSTRGSTL